MKMASTNIIIYLLFLVGIVWLQIFLSKKRNKWLGLVIPAICLIFSILSVLNISVYSTFTSTSTRTETSDGVVIEEVHEAVQEGDNRVKPSIGEILAMVIPVFLLSNIPTIIFLAIYFACREKPKRDIEIEKMNIQDLE